MSELPSRTSRKIKPIRLHFGVLNDDKLEKLLKLGLLSGPKKNLTRSLKMAAVKSSLLKVLTDLKKSFSPTVKLFQAYFFGLPRKPLALLSHYLTKLTFLETFILQLFIFAANDFEKQGIRTIGDSLKKLRRMKHFKMELEGKYQIPPGVLRKFGRDLNRLQGLESLTFGLKGFTFDGPGISAVFSSLSRLTKLKSIHIILSETYCPGDKGMKELANSFPKLKNLRSLNFELDSSPLIGETSMSHFMERLSSLKNLQELDLNFIGCGVNPSSLKLLAQSLGSFNSLSTFKLALYSNELIDPKAYWNLWDAVKGLKDTLQVFEIRTGSTNNLFALENEGLQRLGEILVVSPQLKKVNFTLRGSAEFNDSAVMELGNDVTKATNLLDLEIHFMQCHNISPEALASLKEMLQNKTNIKILTIR